MDDLEYTTLADRYFLRKLAGTGGMAQVYQAWDQLRGTEMAIKVIHDLRFFESFVREAVALRDIAHPNIVRFYSVEKDDEKGIIFIVMEWVEGRDLQRILKKRGGPLGIGEVTSILQGIQRALQYAHKLGICHCDIKPANILLKDADDQPVLSDFGLAHVAHDKGAGGTLAFMAPELFIKGGEYSVSSDIYALGVTLYQLLSGHLPFHGDTKDRLIREHMGKTPPRIQSFNPKVPDGIARVIEKALAKNPSQRQGSVMELWSEFYKYAQTVEQKRLKEHKQPLEFDDVINAKARSKKTMVPDQPILSSHPPKCFISYSWDSTRHRKWVRGLAEKLAENGVETHLDQWDIAPDDQLPRYMEKSVRDADCVLLVCTPLFAQKANGSKGGVGYETTIVTGEIFVGESVDRKFVPLLRSGSAADAQPSYLKTKAYIDFRHNVDFDAGLEELLRHIYDQPKFRRPHLGKKPTFD